jgi:DNA-binding response OmpR family regulator
MKRILVVDDEPDINLALKIVLEDKGFRVDTFEDPLLALDNFRKEFYDLLIVDIKMQKLNGLELFGKIRSIDNKAKVCFITAGEMYHSDDTAVFEGENQFIRKPIENEELLRKVNEIMI